MSNLNFCSRGTNDYLNYYNQSTSSQTTYNNNLQPCIVATPICYPQQNSQPCRSPCTPPCPPPCPIKGQKGEIGMPGYGPQGNPGVKGEKGDPGDPGDKGDSGDKGDAGTDGDKGETGDKGNIGDKGSKGNVGSIGNRGTKGETGNDGEKGDKGQMGDQGFAGSGAMIAYSSGTIATALAIVTVLGGGIADTGVSYTFGIISPTLTLVGTNLDFTGPVNGILPNMSWSVPRDGIITSFTMAFQNTVTLSLTFAGDIFIRSQIYRETSANPGIFIPINGTLIEIQVPNILGILTLAIGGIIRGGVSGLNISVGAGDRLVVFSNTRTTAGLLELSAITGYFNAGIAIS